jgi:exopolysaccharide biosynthesis protein
LNLAGLREGDKVGLIYDPPLNSRTQAYECGSWLVKAGKIVIGERDEWIGVMTNFDPRTAVGIKANGSLILITVDGRQPGFSTGLTGAELAEFLLDYGAENAAMLDGGASTEMILRGKVVNRPSFKGEERMLGGGLIVKLVDN